MDHDRELTLTKLKRFSRLRIVNLVDDLDFKEVIPRSQRP